MRRPFSLPVFSRDKADTLLLIVACLSVLLPHFSHLGIWVSISCVALLIWRGWLTLTGRRLPPGWILIPVSALMMLGVYLNHKTFFGREAGVTMLVLLLTCKLLEMHAKRDLFVVLFLGFFLLLTSFFYQQTIAAAVMTLVSVSLLLTAQLSFHYTGLFPSLKQRLKLGFGMMALAIPLTLCAFFLFPRIQGPLWGLPGDAHSGRSGLSETMSPGGISDLVLSEEIAFRVKFSQPIPNKSLLYWRGIVMTEFDGKTWSPARFLQKNSGDIAQYAGTPITQEIILEPQSQRWLFALDLPAAAPQTNGNNIASINRQMELRSNDIISQRLRYQVTSYPQYRYLVENNLRELHRALEIPVGYNPRSAAFADALRREYSDDSALINAVLQYFRREAFTYTLEPPLLGVNSIDDFLFKSRAGFCEHYASAFVNLMRLAGIPARIVTGYQGGTLNEVDGYFEVRQSDAHAWTEVWLEGQGWVRVDPTAAVAPERVMQNLNQAIPKRGFAGLMNFALSGNSWSQSMRMRLDAINNSWNQWVLNYNQQTQKTFLSSIGFKDIDWSRISLLFFITGSLIIGAIALPLMLNRPSIPAMDRVYLAFCKKMAKKTPPRAVDEGPYAYLHRLKKTLPAKDIPPVEKFLRTYINAKYGQTTAPESQRIRQLKILLAACR